MIHGGLWGNTPAGVANAQGNAPVAGDPPSFIVPPQPSSTADPVWCGVVRPISFNPYPYPYADTSYLRPVPVQHTEVSRSLPSTAA